VFTQTSVAGQVGYIYADYECEFVSTIFQPHSTSLPIYTGPGLRMTLVDSVAVNAVNDDVVLSDPANALALSTIPNGTIYRAVLDVAGSTAGAGSTLANYVNVGTVTRTNVTTLAVSTSGFGLVGGITVYLVVIGTTLTAYNSLEAAVNGAGTGQLFVRTATTTAGSYAFDVALIRYGAALIATTQ